MNALLASRTQTALALCLGLAATVACWMPALGEIVIDAAQDTWVDGTRRDTVMDEDGTSDVLKVSGSRAPARARKGYVRFDLSGRPFDADAPATVVVTAATAPDWGGNHQLRLFALDAGFAPQADQLGTDWDAAALTWNNAPGNEVDGRPAGSATDPATTTFIADHYRDFSREPAIGDRFAFTLPRLGDFLQSDDSLTVMLTISERSGVNAFASHRHETLDGPRLAFAAGDGTRRPPAERHDPDTPPRHDADTFVPALGDIQPVGVNPNANTMTEAEFADYTRNLREAFARHIEHYQPDYSGSPGMLEPPLEGRIETPLPIARAGRARAEIIADFSPELHTPEATLGRDDYPVEVDPMRHTGHIIVENAVSELRYWLGRLTGADIPVLSEPSAAQDRTRIFVGTHFAREHFQDDIDRLGTGEHLDGFAVRTLGADIYIFGATTKGVLNGVYAFVENNADLIWAHSYSDLGTVYTETPDLDAVWADALEVPGTIQRGWLGRFGRRGEPSAAWMWQMRNRNNYVTHQSMAVESGEWGAWREGGGHCIGTALPFPAKPFFPWIPDPETGALRQPERILHYHHNICLTHPDLPARYARAMLARFHHERQVNPRNPMNAFNLGVEDPDANRNYGLCRCERCQVPIRLPDGREIPVQHAVEEGITFRTTQFYLLLDYIARGLAAEFPRARLTTYAYFFAVEPPPFHTIVQPIFCPYAGVPGGQLGRQPNSRAPIFEDSNALWWDYAYGWSRITDLTVLREYYGLAGNGRPFAERVAWDLRGLLPLGIARVTSESPLQDAFAQMDFWVANRLYWAPETDVAELKAYYLQRTFREGAPAMARFFERIHEWWYALHDRPEDFVQLGWIFVQTGLHQADSPMETIHELHGYLQEAEAQARHPLARANITRLRRTFEDWLQKNLEKKTSEEMLENSGLGRYQRFSSFMHEDQPMAVTYVTFEDEAPMESEPLIGEEDREQTDIEAGWTFKLRIRPEGKAAEDGFPVPHLSLGHADEDDPAWSSWVEPRQVQESYEYTVRLENVDSFNPQKFARIRLGYPADIWHDAEIYVPEFALYDLRLTDPEGNDYVMPGLKERLAGARRRWR